MSTPFITATVFSLMFVIIAWRLLPLVRANTCHAVRLVRIAAISFLVMVMASYSVPRLIRQAYAFRPVPDAIQYRLFEGIEYIREVQRKPFPMVTHVVLIDLNSPDTTFLVTPPDYFKERELRARTTSEFLDEYDLQVAINGDFFAPWWAHSILDFYPYSGDPVDALGFAASQGTIYSDVRANHSTVFIYEDNRVSFDERIGEVYNAISGNVLIVEAGVSSRDDPHPYFTNQHPRTAIGLDESGQTLILVVVDGRQPGYSEGASIPELAEILIRYGAYTALNLDGGGSSALVMADKSGYPMLLNVPIHTSLPYRERPVANHLGVYASRGER